jgi:hypothetical protein
MATIYMVIGGYFIVGYWWLLVVIDGYSISGYINGY